MRKTLQDVATYLKKTMVPETHTRYAIKPIYTSVLNEDYIRDEVLAFRAFLVRLYERLETTGNDYDTCKKVAHEYENRTTLSVYYPFLYNVSVLLMKIGYHGNFIEDTQTMLCDYRIFIKKLSVPKNLECLKFLISCGMVIKGINMEDKKQDLSNMEAIQITYPDKPTMLLGMKIMAIAEIDHGTLVNQEVFLRCDYRVLKKDESEVLTILQDTIKPLPKDIQDFMLLLHQRYLDQGLVCVVEIKGFHIYMKYGYRRKDVWGFNVSLANGYHINVKSTKTEAYMETVNTLAPVLQELIAKGYGCGRKRPIAHCDGGCRGLPITLDESVLTLRDDIITWFDQEVACLKKK